MARLLTAVLLAAASAAGAAEHPVMPVQESETNLDVYRERVAPLLAMSEAELVALVPEQSGIYFCDCPNCEAGHQEGQFGIWGDMPHIPWSPDSPHVMRCKYCGHEYPSEDYPMAEVLEVRNPRGDIQRYPYWADENGYRQYFAARIDYHKIRYLEDAANWLARMYVISGEREFARRALLIIHRFARVYPGYCYHFDYPFRDKVIYEGDVDPVDFRPNYRTARWTWWAYMDVPGQLIEAWDQIAASGEVERLATEAGTDVAAEAEAFFRTAAEQVLANREDLGNMSPGMWADLIHAGRVLGEPQYVHEPVARLEQLMGRRFFYDGSWEEGAPSYHSQVVGGLSQVFAAAEGYSDPPGFTHPETGRRFDDLSIPARFPIVARAREYLDLMRLPDGRLAPVHDTWSTNRRGARESSEPFLLPALGHGCLARGSGDSQIQVHLTWSPGLGHRHWDGLSLLVFACGRELLSDLGYTHTRARAWTLATASHNTVVVDLENQAADGGTYGTLRCYEARDPGCQIVSVDNPEVYRDLVTTYRRTLALVAIDEAASYLIDRFEVTGGEQHDLFLHGCADEAQQLTVAGQAPPMQPLATLLPQGLEFVPAANEMECMKMAERAWAYGYLEGLQAGSATEDGVSTVRYAGENGAPQLQTHLLLRAGDELVTGENPSVRNALEDDAKLADHTRPFAMVRATGGRSDFVSVLEPCAGEPRIARVRVLPMPGADAAFEVILDGRRDLVLLGASGTEATWLGRDLTADAELVVLRVPDDGHAEATVMAGSLRWGELDLAATASEYALLAVDRAAHTLTVEGALAAAPGAVVMLDHAGERVSPYTVVTIEAVGGGTRITVVEDPGIEWDADAETSTFVFVPHTSHQGSHVVRTGSVAHVGGQRAGAQIPGA